MNPLHVDFYELYRRHLCRHSEFGINVLHLIAVAGIYLCLFALGRNLPGAAWWFGGVLVVYLAILAVNVPIGLSLLSGAVLILLLALAFWLPPVSPWIYVFAIVAWQRFQVWNHHIFRRELDMSEFREKYPKSPRLSFVLAFYELPTLLQFLCFYRRSWSL